MNENNKREKNSTTRKILDALLKGGGLMFIQAPFVNALNQWSIVSCHCNLSDGAALRLIYRGDLSGKDILERAHII